MSFIEMDFGGSGGGIDVSDTTAVEEDVLAGKIFYNADGEQVEGILTTPFLKKCLGYVNKGTYGAPASSISHTAEKEKDVIVIWFTAQLNGYGYYTDVTANISPTLTVSKDFSGTARQPSIHVRTYHLTEGQTLTSSCEARTSGTNGFAVFGVMFELYNTPNTLTIPKYVGVSDSNTVSLSFGTTDSIIMFGTNSGKDPTNSVLGNGMGWSAPNFRVIDNSLIKNSGTYSFTGTGSNVINFAFTLSIN